MKSTIKKRTEGYGYKYTELADINKYCEANKIRYYQETETCEINGKDYIITYLVRGYMHTDKKGEMSYEEITTKHRGCQVVDAVLQGIKNPVQEYGSSITYCRRYSLLMALGLATEDDDAAGLTNRDPDPEAAKSWAFTFGKYKGMTMQDVIEIDSQYVAWYLNNKAKEYDIKCYEILTGTKIPTEEESKAKQELMVRLNNLVTETDCDYEALKEHYKVKSNNDMTINQLKEAIAELEKRLPENLKEAK